MAIKERLLSAITSVTNADFLRVVTSEGASRNATIANVAKQIVEGYSGSTIAGSAQSVKSAIDAQKNAIDSLNTYKKLVRVSKSYTNITVPASGYVKIGSFSGLGIPTTDYFISAAIRGWSGPNPYSVIRGSNGTDFYLMASTGTITSMSVDYYFAKPSLIEIPN